MPTGFISEMFDDSYKSQAKELVGKMTREEKVLQMVHGAANLARLGIPAYNWWNEALHGVARAGVATVFPQAIGLAATFMPELIREAADVISTEARAKYESAVSHGDRDIYKGLTFWSPNINIFRDPRWGRGHETYGEDTFLTAEMGKAFIRGIQGDDPAHLKAAACAKHYAVHSGPESLRHEFDAVCSMKDLWETYLYAFEDCVVDAKVEAVMGAYNRVSGEPCCGHSYLLKKVLREKWGFDGHVTSDCWAIRDFNEGHGVTKSLAESSALAVKNGCDLNCGSAYYSLLSALDQDLITEDVIDTSLVRLMTARFRLGILGEEPKTFSVPYAAVDCDDHRKLNLEIARRSLVLLKNDGILPVDRNSVKTIAVIGPNSDNRDALLGNYCGTPNEYETPLRGITNEAANGTRVLYSIGCHLYKQSTIGIVMPGERMSEAAACAEAADLVVLCLGLDASLEGEEGGVDAGFGSGDKPDLNLPGHQNRLLETVLATGKPTIVVLISGSALAVPVADEKADAVIQAFYPGALGGRALAQMIFGDYSPSGKLPLTFYRTSEELPPFTDYSMSNRTYKYMEEDALYPFGFGLSYTRFAYSQLQVKLIKERSVSGAADDKDEMAARNEPVADVAAKVRNDGPKPGWESAELYVSSDGQAAEGQPRWQLRGICPVWLEAGEEKTVSFTLLRKHLYTVLEDGSRKLLPGRYTVYVGGSQPDKRSIELLGAAPLSAVITIN